MAARGARAAADHAGGRIPQVAHRLLTAAQFMTAFRQGVRESGYVEGKNVRFEHRWAEDQYDQLRISGERSKRPIRDLSGTARRGHDPGMMARDG